MSEPTQTIEGWYALHDFRTMDWTAWKRATTKEREQAIEEWVELKRAYDTLTQEQRGSFSVYTIVGHKADLLFLYFRPALEDLIACKAAFEKTRLADYLYTPYSYVSIVELSSYLARPEVSPEQDPRLLPRLHPGAPTEAAICFYPMNKRREGNDNWYMLEMKERVELMRSHGLIGRNYAGKVRQVITGSVGFDDWEWGVTLFADDPLQFKKLVYEMRFDETSARYADFGPFYVGQTLKSDDDFIRFIQVKH